jgi:flagellar basal-body rod protein FlgB
MRLAHRLLFGPAYRLEVTMLREILYGSTDLPVMKNALDAHALRQRAVAANIANTDVPGYKAARVTFEERLRRAFGRNPEPLQFTHPGHQPSGPDPRTVRPMAVQDHPPENMGSGVNNVDAEREMGRMATNQIHFALTLRQAQHLFTKMRLAAKGK